MKQTLHILRKDIRSLRIEIALVLSLSAALGLAPITWISTVLEAAALYLIVRLMHAEAIPGDRQFWLTRPYRPMSLLGAKLLFIFAFVNVPIGIAQAVLAVRLGFPLAQEMPGLLWTQVLIFFTAVLPVAALASVTSGLVPFVLAVLILAATALFGESGARELFPVRLEEGPADWIKLLPFGVAVSCVSTAVLSWQYRARCTLFSRLFGLIAYSALLVFYLLVPRDLTLAAQTWFSRDPALASTVRVSIRPETARTSAWFTTKSIVRIPIPVAVAGLPKGAEVRADDLTISFAWAGRTWSPAVKTGVTPHYPAGGESVTDLLIEMDSPLFFAERTAPVTIRGASWFTIFGEPERRTIPLKQGPQNVQDGLQCFSGAFLAGDYMLCRSFFRWPDRLVHTDEGVGDFGDSLISYSPFPASLDLNPLEVRWTESAHLDSATIVTARPLAHFRREFQIEGVCLGSFEKQPVIRRGPVCATKP